MATVIDTLKTYFETGDQPTEAQFAALITALYFAEVPVTANWTTASNALADIETATGIDFPSSLDVFVSLWEGSSDPDDFAVLHAGGTGAPEWVAHNGLACAFTSAPSSGTVYITGVFPQP